MLLLTSEHSVSVNVHVNYFRWYQSTPEALNFGPPSGSLPTGAREIQIQFSSGKPNSSLQYAVLLGRNGAENSPVGQQKERVFIGTPGGTSSSDCVSPQTSGVVQVLYGKVRLNPVGAATVDTVGTLTNQHAYLESGPSYDVGVVAINSPITDLASSRPGGTCIFPDWPYLGGTLWFSPSILTGEVALGPIGNQFNVTSSDPPLTDLSYLGWQINGTTSIGYTLTNNAIGHRQLIEAFGAGVVAALTAALAVEFLKSIVGGDSAKDDSGKTASVSKRPLSAADPNRHPVIAGILVLTVYVAAARARRRSR